MTTDADKIDNLLAQRRELMDKIEEQIDERGRIIERIQSAPDTPIARLRELHRRCSCWGENCGGVRPNVDANSHCAKCIVTWPCTTIAALDALEAELTDTNDLWSKWYAIALGAIDALKAEHAKELIVLQARIDAATVLAEAVQWLIDEARGSREWRATRGMKPATDISRFKACSLSALIVIERELGRALSAWLAGDKEEHGE